MSDELRYFADPMCSWCWGFAPTIARLQQTLPADLPLRVISGGLRAGNRRPIDADSRAQVLHHWHQVQAASGQPFSFDQPLPDGFVYDTEPACRAVSLVSGEQPSQSLTVLHALQAAFYRDGRDVTDSETIRAILCELHLAALAARFDSEPARQAAAQDFEETRNHGISGFPSLLLHRADSDRNRIVCIGYQPFNDVQAALQRSLQRDA